MEANSEGTANFITSLQNRALTAALEFGINGLDWSYGEAWCKIKDGMVRGATYHHPDLQYIPPKEVLVPRFLKDAFHEFQNTKCKYYNLRGQNTAFSVPGCPFQQVLLIPIQMTGIDDPKKRNKKLNVVLTLWTSKVEHTRYVNERMLERRAALVGFAVRQTEHELYMLKFGRELRHICSTLLEEKEGSELRGLGEGFGKPQKKRKLDLPRWPYPLTVSKFLHKWRGRPDHQFAVKKYNRSEYLWTFLGVFVGIAVVALPHHYFFAQEDMVFIIGSFGAMAVLIYATPTSPLAQPRNAVLGHFVSGVIGVGFYECSKLGMPLWLAQSLSVSVSVTVMQFTGSLHPPGAATAIIAVMGSQTVHNLGFLYILVPVETGVVAMLLIALVVNNLSRKRFFPIQWWSKQKDRNTDIVEDEAMPTTPEHSRVNLTPRSPHGISLGMTMQVPQGYISDSESAMDDKEQVDYVCGEIQWLPTGAEDDVIDEEVCSNVSYDI